MRELPPDASVPGDAAPDAFPPLEECDAGDLAFIRQAVPALLGRRPLGIREARVLVDFVRASDRATVIRGLAKSDEFIERWEQFFMDALRVSRIGDKGQGACYGEPLRSTDAGELAAYIRDHASTDGDDGKGEWNMRDLLRSSLTLDDLSPLYRAHLFAMEGNPLDGANVECVELDISRRQDLMEVFGGAYLHRNLVCLTCHNSEFSVTDSPVDRFFPLPGKFEKALFGNSQGRDRQEIEALFRFMGVGCDYFCESSCDDATPWGATQDCGIFNGPRNVEPDPTGTSGFLVEDLGTTGSIWDVEATLKEGFDALRKDGLNLGEDNEVSGPEALAYLVSANIVDQVWNEIMGAPLTVAHNFPRNQAQEEILESLTHTLVESGFSLVALIEAILLDKHFNVSPPQDGCTGTGYPYQAIFNPWVIDETDPERRRNGLGDVEHYPSARALVRQLYQALEWPLDTILDFPENLAFKEEENFAEAEEAIGFQESLGFFLKDSQPGFRGFDFQALLAWEQNFVACEGPGSDADFVDRIAEAAASLKPAATVEDVVVAVRDRLIGDPQITDSEERTALETYLGVGLTDELEDAAAIAKESGLGRKVCGAVIGTPQFLLLGDPGADPGASARIVLPGESSQEFCEKWRDLVFPNNPPDCE